MTLETILVLECIQSFITGLRTGKFIVDTLGFKHGKELELASQFLSTALNSKDKGAAKEAISWFKKVQLDEVVYFRIVAFFGMAVCNIILEEYVISHQYCRAAIELESPSFYKQKVAIIKQKASELRDYLEDNQLLLSQDKNNVNKELSNYQRIELNHRDSVTAVKPELKYLTILNNLENE